MVAMVIARKTILCFTIVVLNVKQIACKYSIKISRKYNFAFNELSNNDNQI